MKKVISKDSRPFGVARYVFYYQGNQSEKGVQYVLMLLKKFNKKNKIKLLIDNYVFLEFDSFDVKVPEVNLYLRYVQNKLCLKTLN